MYSSVADEFNGCNFLDKRLSERVMKIAVSIRENPQSSINMACGSFGQSKAAYRFFENDKVTPEKILSPHVTNTLARAKTYNEPVIIVQDTTSLIYPYESVKELGNKIRSKGYKESVKGIELHTSLAVSLTGTPLGVLKQTYFTYDEVKEKREQKGTNIAEIHKTFPIEKKASYRWIDHFRTTENELKKEGIESIHVGDRESDIYEFLHIAQELKSKFVIRSSSNRKILEEKRQKDTSKLEDVLGAVQQNFMQP
jgi:hypothetical protein